MLSSLTPDMRSANPGLAVLSNRLWGKWSSDNLVRIPPENRVRQHCRTRFYTQWTSGNFAESPQKIGSDNIAKPDSGQGNNFLTMLSKCSLQPSGNVAEKLPPAGGIGARGFPLQVAFWHQNAMLAGILALRGEYTLRPPLGGQRRAGTSPANLGV